MIDFTNKLKTEVNTTTTTTTTHSLELSGSDIRQLLDVPLSARVTFFLPKWKVRDDRVDLDRTGYTLDVEWQTVDET